MAVWAPRSLWDERIYHRCTTHTQLRVMGYAARLASHRWRSGGHVGMVSEITETMILHHTNMLSRRKATKNESSRAEEKLEPCQFVVSESV